MAVQTRVQAKNFIAGEWRDSLEGRTMPVINPASGEPVVEVPNSDAHDVEQAVAAAERAFLAWSRFPPRERSSLLLRIATAIEAHADDLARAEALNVGKPLGRAAGEPLFAADTFRFFAAACRCQVGPVPGEYVRGYTSWVRREPLGVVAAIVPWNYPLLMASWKIAPALAAGNAVVLKPSEQTPLTALMLAEYLQEILPPGVLNIITGEGETAGAALVRHPHIAMVSLTGDVATGQEVARTAAATLKRVHLELGGKAPVIVFPDFDVPAAAARIAAAGYWNSGQDCTAASRILVHQSAFDEFRNAFCQAASSICVGAPDEGDAIEMGPVISETQMQRVLGFIERAESSGAEILGGGTKIQRPGYFIEPTVISHVDQQAEIVQREVFGPVVTIQSFETTDEAVRLANDVDYGLAASVWTNDLQQALFCSQVLEFGTIWINDHVVFAAEMPHGGAKHSGYGKDLSIYALEEYTLAKHVLAKSGTSQE